MQLAAQSGYFADEAVIFMLQPHTMQVHDAQGKVETPDLLEVLVREAGGQQLTLPSLFAPERTPGWSAVLRLSGESLVVRLPGQGSLYEGSMPTEQRWRRDVAATGDVVIITGPMADPTCVDPAIHAGLTTHVRVKLSIRR
ncbi:hypothetical protein [Streptomyces sp. NPDC087212]|uniref:hypothetical protein n=1 Tax=Streptomyces sp. NPDC087212 TaxID=3365766 RepID=UPI0037F11563